ncbi:lysis system i-spanin subunit Rz [Paludibacterium paludis]|uniref:Bacteriophage Rz lysis protein n=1 Tax=Paludibacterium paludis TaxID=1225769 RepID=A0A918U7Z6_9NEIS|nr:lysis system i-spanin subunit Rz [Paludibacterium paludis]GGY06999.1 hypothetical protein GCM10011289_06980 [Paludibacterium paludis]
MRVLIVLIAGLAIGSALFFWGRHEARTELAAKTAMAAARARERERADAQAFGVIDRELTHAWKTQLDEKNRTIDDLRSGALKLRRRLAARVPDAPAGAGQRDASAAGGLLPEDAAFLVRLAADADRNTEQLAACQRLLSAERAGPE